MATRAQTEDLYRRDQWGRRLAWGGFGGFEEFIRGQGGIVSRAELLDAGWTADELRIARGCYGRPTRLRRGWYCSSDVPAVVRRSWAHGGPLACWSALEWHASAGHDVARGLLERRSRHSRYSSAASRDLSGGPDPLHICLPPHAQARRCEAVDPSPIVRHWHPVAEVRSARWAVPIDVAIGQALRCSERRDPGPCAG
ncbi:hypothetical protein OVN20_01235 [Microcella daejeonensis]|uniref:hypothetical protein n=1 Tax=Microcella daejeonensis TaxID=2994971 RepID=UPI0022714834|nr:hypothetical protein [Microcella daejeonensis]WAB84227.1 hypothetical protein OVN20_01235 [Microcella daejeonensis]